jgi:Protein of unknown function (DUF642)/PEP-CTERM motif
MLGNRNLVVLAVAALLAAPAAGEAANLLTNGSFEDITNFSDNHPGDDTTVLAVGDTSMPGWTVVGTDGLAWIGPTNPFLLSAADGQYFLDLTGYTSQEPSGGVSQTIATTPGTNYELTFALGSDGGYGLPSAITVSTGAATQTFTSTLTGSNNWESETMDFTATGPSTTISLIGVVGNQYIGLDNVSLTDIPEPASMVLLGAGLFGLRMVRRRRV